MQSYIRIERNISTPLNNFLLTLDEMHRGAEYNENGVKYKYFTENIFSRMKDSLSIELPLSTIYGTKPKRLFFIATTIIKPEDKDRDMSSNRKLFACVEYEASERYLLFPANSSHFIEPLDFVDQDGQKIVCDNNQPPVFERRLRVHENENPSFVMTYVSPNRMIYVRETSDQHEFADFDITCPLLPGGTINLIEKALG